MTSGPIQCDMLSGSLLASLGPAADGPAGLPGYHGSQRTSVNGCLLESTTTFDNHSRLFGMTGDSWARKCDVLGKKGGMWLIRCLTLRPELSSLQTLNHSSVKFIFPKYLTLVVACWCPSGLLLTAWLASLNTTQTRGLSWQLLL